MVKNELKYILVGRNNYCIQLIMYKNILTKKLLLLGNFFLFLANLQSTIQWSNK
jgi:hypothetical protein